MAAIRIVTMSCRGTQTLVPAQGDAAVMNAGQAARVHSVHHTAKVKTAERGAALILNQHALPVHKHATWAVSSAHVSEHGSSPVPCLSDYSM